MKHFGSVVHNLRYTNFFQRNPLKLQVKRREVAEKAFASWRWETVRSKESGVVVPLYHP